MGNVKSAIQIVSMMHLSKNVSVEMGSMEELRNVLPAILPANDARSEGQMDVLLANRINSLD